MKKLFTLVLLALSFNAFSQDQIPVETNQSLEQDVQDIKLHLHLAHKQYKTGTIFLFGGIATSVLGSYLFADGAAGGKNLMLIGSGMSLLGGLIHIDSHKYFGRAGVPKKSRLSR